MANAYARKGSRDKHANTVKYGYEIRYSWLGIAKIDFQADALQDASTVENVCMDFVNVYIHFMGIIASLAHVSWLYLFSAWV